MILGEQDIRDLMFGASVLGIGGGGSMEVGLEKLLNIIEDQKIEIGEPKNKNDLILSAYLLGSVQRDKDDYQDLEKEKKITLKALWELQQYLEQPVSAILPIEIGPNELAESIRVACILNLPIIDADATGGHASPTIIQTLYKLYNIPQTPLVGVESSGDIHIFEDEREETIETFLRKISHTKKTWIRILGHPLSMKKTKKYMSLGTVTRALALGRDLRNKDISLNEIMNKYGAYYIARGRISKVCTGDIGGFLEGWFSIKTKKSEFKIFIKNENITLYHSDKLIANAPDLICVLDSNTRQGIINIELKQGMEVSIFVIPGLSCWKTENGKEIYSKILKII